jgi:hypothetical protein
MLAVLSSRAQQEGSWSAQMAFETLLSVSKVSRRRGFYRWVSDCFETYQELFVPFMDDVWMDLILAFEQVSTILKHIHDSQSGSSKQPKTPSKKGKAKRKRDRLEGEEEEDEQEEESESFMVEKIEELLDITFYAHLLSSTLQFDIQSEFLDCQRFEQIVAPFRSLLFVASSSLFSDHLMPLFGLMTSSLSNNSSTLRDDTWKKSNHDLLHLTRSSEASTRNRALGTIRRCFLDCGEEYLILLPETIPFLSELLEDPVDSIERKTRTFLDELTELSGEDMEDYMVR